MLAGGKVIYLIEEEKSKFLTSASYIIIPSAQIGRVAIYSPPGGIICLFNHIGETSTPLLDSVAGDLTRDLTTTI